MNNWEARPIQVARILNPAFCGLLVRRSVESYTREANGGMPYALLVLILPIVLHRKTRKTLPRSTGTSMHTWLQNHSDVKVGFADRTRELVPFSREALRFLMIRNLLETDPAGHFIPSTRRLPSGIVTYEQSGEEITECVNRTRFLGRWFARAGTTSTVYAIWGIRP